MDISDILDLYQNAKNQELCVWNEYYPTITEIEHDLETNNLYVMSYNEEIVGAISIVPENEMDYFECWSCTNSKEIARVVVAKEFQGQKISYKMIQYIESILSQQEIQSIHLAVAKINIPAYKTYTNLGFKIVSEADMYGNNYYLMEKKLNKEYN